MNTQFLSPLQVERFDKVVKLVSEGLNPTTYRTVKAYPSIYTRLKRRKRRVVPKKQEKAIHESGLSEPKSE